jgi:hypothetical protein
VGDFFLGGVIAVSLTKLLLRMRSLGAAAPVLNKAVAQGMLAIVSIMRLGESPALPTPLDSKCLPAGAGLRGWAHSIVERGLGVAVPVPTR